MYGHHIKQSIYQPDKVANPARGQLNREKNVPLSPCVPENFSIISGKNPPLFLLATTCVWVWMACSLHSVTTGSRDRANVSLIILMLCVCVCVCMFPSHSFWTSSSLDVPAGDTQEEGHTGFLIHLLSAVRALIFLARRIQPFLSLVDREVEFLCTNDLIVLHPLGMLCVCVYLLNCTRPRNPALSS